MVLLHMTALDTKRNKMGSLDLHMAQHALPEEFTILRSCHKCSLQRERRLRTLIQ